MARPATVSDADLLAATARVVLRLGPLSFTLADVGREVGLTAPAVLKRFGSKRALLLALSASSRAELPRAYARREGETALGALLRALADQARGLDTPRELANGLAFLAIDVTDEEFRAHAVALLDAMRARIRALLDEAVREKELRRCDTEALARAVEVAWHGSILAHGVRHARDVPAEIARDVEALLAPFRTRRRGPAAPIPRALRPSRAAGRAARGT